jgi:hypothetical protein
MKRCLPAVLAFLVAASLASGAEVVSKAKGFAVDFPAPVKESIEAPPENAVAMTQWVAESTEHGFVLLAIDWAQGDPLADALFDLMRDNYATEYGTLVDEAYIHSGGRPGRALRYKGAQGFFVVRLFFDRAARRSFLMTAGNTRGTETPALTRFAESFRFLDPIVPQVYSSPEDGVSVAFPGPVTVTQHPDATPETAHPMLIAQVDGIDHMLIVMRGSGQVEKKPEEILDFVRAGSVRGVKGGRLIAERRIKMAGLPGREFEVEAGSGQLLINRLIIDPSTGRMYMLSMTSRPQRVEPARVEAFFDSFRLLSK